MHHGAPRSIPASRPPQCAIPPLLPGFNKATGPEKKGMVSGILPDTSAKTVGTCEVGPAKNRRSLHAAMCPVCRSWVRGTDERQRLCAAQWVSPLPLATFA